MIWDDDSIKLLEKLWEKGLSTTEIAKKMNISKNSVVGKVHRLCLKARPSPIKKKEESAEDNKEKSSKKTAKKEKVTNDVDTVDIAKNDESKTKKISTDVSEKIMKVSVDSVKSESITLNSISNKNTRNIKLVELDSHTCRWPIGDPRDDDFCFCGKKVRAGQTYCDEHSQVAYVKALIKK